MTYYFIPLNSLLFKKKKYKFYSVCHNRFNLQSYNGLPGGSAVKNLPANAGDMGSIPGSGRFLGEENGNPLQYCCLENPMERNLAGYSPWNCKESDTTE